MLAKRNSFYCFCSLFTVLLLLNGFLQIHCLDENKTFRPMGRVVGGSDAAVNSAPYIVSFQYKAIHYCAGSIINSNWIVTAAHCLKDERQVKGTNLIAGSIKVDGGSSTVQTRTISKYVGHDLYTGGSTPYDIGLVYVKEAYKWSDAVKAISLPTSGVIPTGTADLYGWGSISKTTVAKYPTILQAAKNIPIITLKACETALGSKAVDVHETNLCTGPLTGGVGICTSDSGGPLVQSNGKGQTTLIGVVSWGKLPCGQAKSPSVYVQVSSFISWIAKNQKI